MYLYLEYIGYWLQTRDGRHSPAQTTVQVNWSLFSQYLYWLPSNSSARIVLQGWLPKWCVKFRLSFCGLREQDPRAVNRVTCRNCVHHEVSSVFMYDSSFGRRTYLLNTLHLNLRVCDCLPAALCKQSTCRVQLFYLLVFYLVCLGNESRLEECFVIFP